MPCLQFRQMHFEHSNSSVCFMKIINVEATCIVVEMNRRYIILPQGDREKQQNGNFSAPQSRGCRMSTSGFSVVLKYGSMARLVHKLHGSLPSLTIEKKSVDIWRKTALTMTKLMAERCRNCRPWKGDGL